MKGDFKMRKLKLLVIDNKMNSVEVEIEEWVFKQMGISPKDINQNKSKSALNRSVTEFLKNSEEK